MNIDNFKIYTSFDNFLRQSWQKLYEKGGAYNLSPKWCEIWFKHFGGKNSLHIIAYEKENELKLLAPFRKKGNKLFPIGVKPDLIDEFGILYENQEILGAFFEFLKLKKLDLFLRFLNADSEIAKYIVKKFAVAGIRQMSHVSETKPFLNKPFTPSRKLKDDIKRCKNNAIKLYEDELLTEINVAKDEKYINEFIKIHKSRWNGGMLEKKKNMENFIRSLFDEYDEILLSRLYFKNSGKTCAYHLGYLDSGNVFRSSMPAYNQNYRKISPGKILLFEILQNLSEKGVEKFDFGRGSEPYKSWFANGENILFSISSCDNSPRVFKIRKFAEKIFYKVM